MSAKTQCAKGYALVEFDVVTDFCGFADDDACAMVDEKVFADFCAWVDVYACL